jgi:hypothetical protein
MTCGLKSLRRAHVILWFYVAVIACLLFATPAHSFAPRFTVQPAAALETAGAINVVIRKDAKASSYSKVKLTTADATAKAGVDYQPVSVTLTFGNSDLVKTVAVPIINRPGYQGVRGFTVSMTAVRNATLYGAVAPITINEADAPAAWAFCAAEGEDCKIAAPANVRYGVNSSWIVKPASGSIHCGSIATWGYDPAQGLFKHCETD